MLTILFKRVRQVLVIREKNEILRQSSVITVLVLFNLEMQVTLTDDLFEFAVVES